MSDQHGFGVHRPRPRNLRKVWKAVAVFYGVTAFLHLVFYLFIGLVDPLLTTYGVLLWPAVWTLDEVHIGMAGIGAGAALAYVYARRRNDDRD